jgi:hypothetical protein
MTQNRRTFMDTALATCVFGAGALGWPWLS